MACVRNVPIGIGNDPFTFGISLRRGVRCRDCEVDSVCSASGDFCHRSNVKAFTASDIENNILLLYLSQREKAVEKRRRHSVIVDPPPCCNDWGRVSRFSRPAVLRLQQIDISASCDID